jgi:protein-S-isoprenylcysteine O-methyltransferase Ste14
MNTMSNDRFYGKVIVGASIAFNTVFLGRATAGLSIAMAVAYFIWRDRRWKADGKRVFYAYVLSLGCFVLHFAEEYFTDFYVAFPRLMGDSWSARSFLIFNLVWFTVFVLSAAALWYEKYVSYLIVIFFALAGGVANGAAHISISLWQWRYFPGTLTAPLMLACGLILFQRLQLSGGLLVARAVAFTLLVPGAIVWWIPQNFIRIDWTIRHTAGWLPVTLGAMLYFWCAAQFLTRGQGTPNIFFARHLGFLIGQEPLRLVHQSIYRYSRNPMYVGVVTTVFGEALLFGSWNLLIYAFALCIWFHLVVVFIEEPHLRRTRGESYLQYCRETPRWVSTKLLKVHVEEK